MGSPAPRNATRREIASLRRRVTAGGIALIALIIAADSYEAWQDYRRVVADNAHIMGALSRALAEQTDRLVQEVDVVLSDYVDWIYSTEGRAAEQTAMIARLHKQVVSLPFVASAALLRADGTVRASTQQSEVGANLQGSESFSMAARAAEGPVYIDRPAKTPGSDARTFAISRRIDAPDGTLAGVLVARVTFEYLEGFYAGVNVTPDTSIRLSRTDGVTLVEYPPLKDERSAVSGDREIQISREVRGYPIVVTVSRSSEGVLQPWIQEERSSAARTSALVILASGLLLALRSALSRQQQMNQERYRLEQELASVQRVEALGLLAASVTHDFNNVLTAIIGYAELMRDMVDIEPDAMTNIDRLLAATERARLLVRRVLTFDPRRGVSYRPTPVEPIVAEVAQHVQASLPPEITITMHGLSHSTNISGDATEIYQVIMNLCSNAVHAMPAGGELQLLLETLTVVEEKRLALGRLQPGLWVRLAVVDSGVGLAEEQTTSIFEAFYTTRKHAHGTGIGLTVVRNILLRMNGALEVDSQLGRGTRMAVYWPVTPAAPEREESGRSETAGAGETILVVDDEKELVVLTEELLASLSYEPVGFSDARAALDAVRIDPTRFDAILTDERMQPLRGLDFATLVHEIQPDTPIILMTGHRDAELDARAKEAGIAEILDKPLRVQMLKEALARLLDAARR